MYMHMYKYLCVATLYTVIDLVAWVLSRSPAIV